MRGNSYLEARQIQRIKVVDLLKLDYDVHYTAKKLVRLGLKTAAVLTLNYLSHNSIH